MKDHLNHLRLRWSIKQTISTNYGDFKIEGTIINKCSISPTHSSSTPNLSKQFNPNTADVIENLENLEKWKSCKPRNSSINYIINCLHPYLSGLFRRGVRSHAHAPTHAQKCLDVQLIARANKTWLHVFTT